MTVIPSFVIVILLVIVIESGREPITITSKITITTGHGEWP